MSRKHSDPAIKIQPSDGSSAAAGIARRRSDPAMLGKPIYSRLPLDSYFTIAADELVPWLLDAVPIYGRILEPCAGRGHLSLELPTAASMLLHGIW